LKSCERQRPGPVFGTAREYIPVRLREKHPCFSRSRKQVPITDAHSVALGGCRRERIQRFLVRGKGQGGNIRLAFALLACLAATAATSIARADEAAARRWIDQEFQPSTLTKEQQLAELKWFIAAAAQLRAQGVNEISVVSETITTHEYESKTLA